MEIVYPGVLIGILATLGLDAWAMIVKHLFRLPTADWALVGRWLGHMPKGIFFHDAVSEAPRITQERLIGWAAHYATGIVYGLAYLGLVRVLLSRDPSIASALVFGLATLLAPWFIMQPGMGAGVFASRAPRPNVVRLVNLSMHVVFGASLYAAWLLIQ
jgi:hypothetical protein